MDKVKIERFFEIITPEQKAVLTTLYNASVSTLKAYQIENSASNLRNYKAASDALDQMVVELEARHFGKPECFANVKEALAFLQAKGYKIAKSKMYSDAKKGILRIQEDKSVLEADALAYAVRAGLDKAVTEKSKIDDSVFADKANAELELLEVRKQKLRFEHEKQMGLYLLKADVRAELAMKLGAIEAGFKNMVAVNLADWIEAAGGDVKSAPEVQETIFYQLDGLMNEFCAFDELTIVLRPAGCTISDVEEV